MRRLALVVLASLLFAVPAAAKYGPPFDRASARAGATIRINEGLFSVARTDAWLLPLGEAKAWWPDYGAVQPTYGPVLRLRAMRRLGTIPHWATLDVRVPDVPPGRYVLAYRVPSTGARWTSARPDYVPNLPGNVLRVVR